MSDMKALDKEGILQLAKERDELLVQYPLHNISSQLFIKTLFFPTFAKIPLHVNAKKTDLRQ